MATWSTSQDNSSYGNVKMRIWVGRGDCTRTATSVSFKFGVCFRPLEKNTTNSVAAWYGGVQKFAYANAGHYYDEAPVRANKGTDYYAYYSDRDSTRGCTTEQLCFTYTNDNINASTASVKVTIGVGWNDWAGTNKGNLTFSLPIPIYHGVVGTGTVNYIRDNYDNTYTIKVTRGAAGDNNAVTSAEIRWAHYWNGSTNAWDVNTESFTSTSKEKTITLDPLTTHDTRGVVCAVKTVGTYPVGTASTGTATYSLCGWEKVYINQYLKPTAPKNIRLDYLKSRLTNRETWTYRWDAGTKSNNTSPVKGHRVCLLINGKSVAIKNSQGTVISATADSNGIHYWYTSISSTYATKMNIHPKLYGLKAGDKVQIKVQAYTQNGQNNDGTKIFSAEAASAENTVENAGIVRVNVGGTWREGQVWVNVGGTWHEAQSVYANVGGTWQEST